jgi:adenylate cyclase class IV
MNTTNPLYEVETRFGFQDQEEVWNILGFLQPCLTQEIAWNTTHYSVELFQRDQIVRVNRVEREGGSDISFSLGWKGPDIGKFANIRLEIDEDITAGIVNSRILAQLNGRTGLTTPDEVRGELLRLGHQGFMSFTGRNLVGFYQPLELQLKLMVTACPVLRWPLLLEIEKTAHSPAEALELEQELEKFSRKYGMLERVVREEPPTLLYRALNLDPAK